MPQHRCRRDNGHHRHSGNHNQHWRRLQQQQHQEETAVVHLGARREYHARRHGQGHRREPRDGARPAVYHHGGGGDCRQKQPRRGVKPPQQTGHSRGGGNESGFVGHRRVHSLKRPVDPDKRRSQQIKRNSAGRYPRQRPVFALGKQHQRQEQEQVELHGEERQQRAARKLPFPLDQLRRKRHRQQHQGGILADPEAPFQRQEERTGGDSRGVEPPNPEEQQQRRQVDENESEISGAIRKPAQRPEHHHVIRRAYVALALDQRGYGMLDPLQPRGVVEVRTDDLCPAPHRDVVYSVQVGHLREEGQRQGNGEQRRDRADQDEA